MRKIITLAIAGLLAFAAVALAVQENSYTVDGATSPTSAGSKKKPVPVQVKFGYTVAEKSGKRPALIKQYSINFAGLQVNGSLFKGCSAAKIDQDQTDANCPKGSLMGTGNVENNAGQTANEADKPDALKCHLDLKFYNAGKNKATLYLKGGPSDPRGPAKSCPLDVNKAIDANFVQNAKGTSLVFSVDETLLHPAPGIDNAVVDVNSVIKKVTKKVKGKTRGYFESFGGCKNKKRPITVTFTAVSGSTGKAQDLAPCKA
ncbi:MAG: hypothetical protein ACJ762_18805 [Solirubrobacteraceae bacterium]